MGVDITCTVGYLDSTGAFQPLQGKAVYLRPSRSDIHIKRSSTWYPWEGNPDGDAGYKDCVKAVTNGSGIATFANVPFTDTECYRPIDPATAAQGAPPVKWLVIDPNAQSGVKVYSGPLPSTLPNPSYSTKDLVALASPDTWSLSGTAWASYPEGRAQVGEVSLSSSSDEATITFSHAFTTLPRMIFGSCADENGSVIAVGVKQDGTGTLLLSTTGCTVKASATPASTIKIWYRAEGI